WVSDGTEEGTKTLRKFLGSFTSTNPEYFTYFKDKVYLSVGERYNAPDLSEVLGEGRELWSTDGTEDGTEMVIDIREGVHHSNVRFIVTTSNYLYFIADYEEDKQGLYQSDGTAEGTILIDDSISEPEFNFPNLSIENLFAIGDKIIMFTETIDAEDGDGELQIWTSTVLDDIESKRLSSIEVNPNPFGQQTFISFSDRIFSELIIQLYNSAGQKMAVEYTQKQDGIVIERGDLKAGMYFFEVMGESGKIGGGKLIVED
ncbi:MAG: T9SS type A sorting domain-containing protein, partial [Chitinophagales bacterium]